MPKTEIGFLLSVPHYNMDGIKTAIKIMMENINNKKQKLASKFIIVNQIVLRFRTSVGYRGCYVENVFGLPQKISTDQF